MFQCTTACMGVALGQGCIYYTIASISWWYVITVMCLCIPVPTGSQELHVSEPRSPAQVPAALSPPPTGQSEPQPTTTGVYIKLFVPLYLDNL